MMKQRAFSVQYCTSDEKYNTLLTNKKPRNFFNKNIKSRYPIHNAECLGLVGDAIAHNAQYGAAQNSFQGLVFVHRSLTEG
jgi:hypothetical protein